ncbi:MAG: hypothetical protein JNJ57_19750, partial [Saprospiraceae bacterium]|nr:hypothetical protein [Saprospiraceae bacterium]
MALRFLLISISVSCCLVKPIAQTKPTAYLQGYAKEIAGKRFGYHSPLPQVNTALLIRGQADYVPIEWETEKIPADFAQPIATFIWMFGMDVVTTPSQFQLSINDRVWFDFNSASSSQLGNNRIYGIEGAILDFNVTMLDKYQDQMGFAILRIPATAATPGKPLKLKVSSKTKGNDAWYMTFKSGIQENIEIYQNKVVAKRNGALLHSVSIDFVHIGEDVPVMVKIGSEQAKAVLKAGFNKIEMLVPKALSRQERMAEIKIGTNAALKKKFTLEPVRPWEIYLVQHTHTDI